MNVWGGVSYYTPTKSSEYFYFVASESALTDHAAIANASSTYTINTSDRTCSNPADLTKTEKKNLSLNLKDGSAAKTAVINIAGCSAVTICHTSNSSRKIKAVLTPSSGKASIQYGSVSSTKTTFDLDGTKSYSILFTAVDNAATPAGADLYATAIVLTKAVGDDPEPDCTPLAVYFAAGEGTGTMTAGECCPGKTYAIPACGFTAPTGKEFDAWTSSPEVTITDGKFTMPDEAVTLTATWKDLPAAPDFTFVPGATSGNLTVGNVLATTTGGVMTVYSTKTETSLKWASNGLNFSGGQADQVIVELDKVFVAGSVVTVKMQNTSTGTRGLNLLSEAGKSVMAMTQDGTGEFTKTYTVVAGGGLAGNNVFRLQRNNSTFLKSIEITGLGSAVVKWNVTFDMQDATSAAIEAQSVKDGKKAVKPADPEKTGFDFAGWVVASTDVAYDWNAAVTADVALKATWTAAATKYTVTYKDGETVLGSEQVVAGQKAANVPTPTKELNTFAGWEDEEHHAIDFATATINADLTAYAKWTPMGEATSIDIEQFVLDNSKKGDIKAALTAHNFDYNLTLGDSKDGLDSLASGKAASNYEYLGLKMKTNGSYVVGNIPAGKRVDVVIGNLGSAKVQINGADAAALAAGVEADSLPAHNYYDLPEGGVLKVLSTGTKTTVLKGIILGEIPAVSDDATLSAIKLDGVDIAGFAAGTGVYNVRLAYGAALPEITVTVNNEHATYTVHPATEENNYYATVRVTAEAGNTLDYQVRFTWAPKMGAEIIKATITGTTTATVDGLIGGTAEVSLSGLKDGGYKVDKGKYIGITLAAGETFNEGDVVVINSSVKGTGGKVVLFADKNKTVKVYEGTDAGQEIVYVTLPAEAEDLTSLYIVRDAKDETYKWNPVLVSFAVLRQMPSIIKSFTIGETEGVIDQMNKTIAVSVPFGTVVTALTPEVEAYANGGATVTPAGAQNFTSAQTYTVSSAYTEDDAVSYEVTVTVAEPACPTEVTISGTATYTDGDAIELTATTDGTGSVTYQWYKDGVLIDGATATTFSKTATMTDGGEYVCKVNQGTCEEVASAPYAVTVSKKAVTSIAVTSEGDVVRVKKGESLNLTATITPADATYREVTWSSEGTPAYFTFADENANPAAAIASRVGSSKKVYAKADSKTGTIQLTCYVEVVYNVNGGDAIANAEYDGGTAITLPTPTGGTEPFLGWYSDAEFNTKVGDAGATYKPADNVTLYAKWTLPDAETPVFSQNIADHEYPYGTETFEALTVAASPVTSYQWYKNNVAIDGATTATYTPTTIGTYKVVATNAPAGYNPATAYSEAVISVAAPAEGYTLQAVNGDRVWDWKNGVAAYQSAAYNVTDEVLANITGVTFDSEFHADEIQFTGSWGARHEGTNNYQYYMQATQFQMNFAVAGKLVIYYRGTGSSKPATVIVNGETIGAAESGTGNAYAATYPYAVQPGMVTVDLIGENDGPVRICKIEFTTATVVAATDAHPVTTVDAIATLCSEKDIVAHSGGAFYYVSANDNGALTLTEATGVLHAGYPYIYISNGQPVKVVYGAGEPVADPKNHNGLYATFVDLPLGDGYALIKNNKYYRTHDGNNNGCYAHHCYIKLDEIAPETMVATAPGEDAPAPVSARRVVLGTNEGTVATDINALDQNVEAQKIFRDGAIIILRGGKMYNVNGQLLK